MNPKAAARFRRRLNEVPMKKRFQHESESMTEKNRSVINKFPEFSSRILRRNKKLYLSKPYPTSSVMISLSPDMIAKTPSPDRASRSVVGINHSAQNLQIAKARRIRQDYFRTYMKEKKIELNWDIIKITAYKRL